MIFFDPKSDGACGFLTGQVFIQVRDAPTLRHLRARVVPDERAAQAQAVRLKRGGWYQLKRAPDLGRLTNQTGPFHCSIVKIRYHVPLLRVRIATLARRRYARRLARTQSHGFPGFIAVTAGASGGASGASREGTVARNADTRGKAGDAHAADDAGEDEEQACAQKRETEGRLDRQGGYHSDICVGRGVGGRRGIEHPRGQAVRGELEVPRGSRHRGRDGEARAACSAWSKVTK